MATSPDPAVFDFDADTQLSPDTDGRYLGRVSERWHIGRVPNGGYTLAIAARAMADALAFGEPLVVSGHYLSPAESGPCVLDVTVLKAGRANGSAMAAFVQDGRERARFVGRFGDLTGARGPTRLLAEPPPLPDPEECLRFAFIEGLTPAIVKRFDLLMPPDQAGWLAGRLGETAELGGWIRFADGRPPDPLSLLLFADAFPPAVFSLLGMQSWVPTLELTVQVRGRPAPGWLRCWFRSRYITSGYLEEDGEIWDSQGRLVALSRQLALLRQGS